MTTAPILSKKTIFSQPDEVKGYVKQVLNNPLAKELIQEISGQTIYEAIVTIGMNDSLELIELLSPQQLQTVIDFDVYQKDQFLSDQFLSWIKVSMHLGVEFLGNFIRNLDIEQRLVGLSEMFKVHIEADFADREYDKEFVLDEALCFMTKDNRYQIEVKEEFADELQNISEFINLLYAYDNTFAMNLLDELRFSMKSETEENALRFRNSRLADYGIYPYWEAIEIYQYRSVPLMTNELLHLLPKHYATDNIETIKLPISPNVKTDYYLQQFFNLEHINLAVCDNIKYEVTGLCHKVASSEGFHFGNIDAWKHCTTTVQSLVNLGVDHLISTTYLQNAEHQDTLLIDIFTHISTHHLFSLGLNCLTQVRKILQKVLKEFKSTLFQLNYLLTDLESDFVHHFNQRVPKIIGTENLEKNIEHLYELNHTKLTISTLLLYSLWTSQILSLSSIESESDVESGLLQKIVTTSVLQRLTSGLFSPKPIEQQTLKTILTQHVTRSEEIISLSESFKKEFSFVMTEAITPILNYSDYLGISSHNIDQSVHFILNNFEQEIVLLSESENISGKYISSFFLV